MTNTTPNRGRWTHVLPTTLARMLRGSLRRWPTVAALGLTGYIVLDDLSTGSDLAAVLTASGLVYLGAAALKKPATAWPLFWGAVAVIIASEQLVADSAPTWVLLGLAGLLLGYGLLHGAARPAPRATPSNDRDDRLRPYRGHHADRRRGPRRLPGRGRAAGPCGVGRLAPPGQQGCGALAGRVLLCPGHAARRGHSDRGCAGLTRQDGSRRSEVARLASSSRRGRTLRLLNYDQAGSIPNVGTAAQPGVLQAEVALDAVHDPAGQAWSGAWAASGCSNWSRVAAQLARSLRPSREADPGSAPYTTSDSPASAGRASTS
jgi:hypothetical protein